MERYNLNESNKRREEKSVSNIGTAAFVDSVDFIFRQEEEQRVIGLL